MPAGDDFSSLFELLTIGAYRTDAQSRQFRANRAMVRIFGFESEAEMLAHPRSRMQGWYADPNRRQAFRDLLEAQGSVRDFVSEMRRHDTGEAFWISENAHLVRDAEGRVLYHEGTVEDITERKRAAESLQLTLDNAGRGIVRLDAAGRIVLYNRHFQELLDIPEDWLAGEPAMVDIIRKQKQRGDFGPDNQLLYDKGFSVETAGSIRHMLDGARTYLRRTLTGKAIEVTTQPLPDGGVVRTYSDVTEYVNVQEALARKSQDLQITLDSMAQGICTMNAAGRAIMSNRRYGELLGFSEELMASQPTMEQLVRLQIDRGDFGEDFKFVDAVARGYVAEGDKVPAIQGPEVYMRKTTDGRTLEVLTRPLPDGGVVRTFTDMTAYVRAQETLAEKEAQLSTLIDNIPDWVWLQDAKGVYLLSNPAYQRHHGFTGDEVRGKTPELLFGPEVGARYRASDEQAMQATEPLVYEDARRDAATGEMQYFELVKVGMRDEKGRAIGMLGIARDITSRKAAEAALIAARDAAEAGERAKAEFLANMSHEIRTPMNAVIGMSDLLLDSPMTPQQREFAETIRTSGDALLTLINDILDFSKIESGHLALEHVPFELADCVEGALDLSSGAAAAKGLDLLYWIDDEVPRAIVGDAARLRQVFVNLISNAVKFTQQGEVVVTLSRREGPEGQPLLHTSVRDTGIGIPADRMNRLFQVFSQVDASTTRKFGGTGLGLAICRRLVTLMGGRIWVESRAGEGADFQFELPCITAPGRPNRYVSRRPANLAARRLLIVDDNAANRHILTLQTRRWGMQSQAAASGAQALEWIDAGQPFDAAILDVQMPDMDGYTLAAELRQRPATARLPLLVLTSVGAVPAQPGLQLAQTLSKPIKSQTLFEALSGLFATTPPPVAPTAAPAADTRPRLAHEIPLHLLLAEDNVMNQRVAALLLNGLGYELQTVGDGQAALDAVAAANARGEPLDVLFLDVQMPVLDGLAAARQLCALYPSPVDRPWIVAMTANAMQGDREQCLAAGMDDYLSKPIRAQAVSEALRRAAAGLASRRGS
ncbi:PAS domain-containing hybrid sensor histidine kinase/response regulator [Caenimonas sedimenti]|nr:PAS-domain containing protein [Caenimonas sedimenti]